MKRVIELIVTFGLADYIKDTDGTYRRSVIDRECSDFEQKSFLKEVHMVASGNPCDLKDWPREYRQFCNRDIDRNEPVYVVAGQSLSCCNLRDGIYMQLADTGYEPVDFILIRTDEALYREIPKFEERVSVYDYMVKRMICEVDVTKDAATIFEDWKASLPEHPEEEDEDDGTYYIREDGEEYYHSSDKETEDDELWVDSCLSLVLERNQRKLDDMLDVYRRVYPDEQTVVVSEYFPDGWQRYCVCRPCDVVGKLKEI